MVSYTLMAVVIAVTMLHLLFSVRLAQREALLVKDLRRIVRYLDCVALLWGRPADEVYRKLQEIREQSGKVE